MIVICVYLFFINGCTQINNMEITSVPFIKEPQITDNKLKVLSWNIKMYPAPYGWFFNRCERAENIIQLLKDLDTYDVIFFQEAFSKSIRNKIFKGLNNIYSYQIEPNDQTAFYKINSGLWVISRLPIKLKNQISFTKFSETDGFASKGAKLFSIIKDNNNINLIHTHLQSDYSTIYSEVRTHQYSEIYNKLILPNENDGIFILIGDLNISKPLKLKKMLQKLKFNNGPIIGNLQHSIVGNSKKILDYILVRDNEKIFKSITRKIIDFSKKFNDKKYNLSDHYPIEAILIW